MSSEEMNATGVVAMAMPDRRTRLQKLKSKLFPAKRCMVPDAPSSFKDVIHGYAVSKLDWKDRLRVLFTGIVVTQWKTVTQNEVGISITNAECHIGTSSDWS